MRNAKENLVNEIPIDIIQNMVSTVTFMNKDMLMKGNKERGARKRELCNARQLSMMLCREHTRNSLAVIGEQHGNRDHATVLHACKQINILTDINDPMVTQWLTKTEEMIDIWCMKNINPHNYSRFIRIKSIDLLNFFITSMIPLKQRMEYLNLTC